MESPASSATFSPASSATFSPAIDASAAAKEPEGALSQVDPFLVEALENPRHRLTVLRMELDIQKFMQTPDQHQFEFQHLPTSYLRRAAHRVAQHYGLQTMALGNIVDGLGSRVIARKALDSKFPSVRLSEVPAKQPEKEISDQVKIAIRPRPSNASPNGTVELGNKISAVRTVEEREEEYDKARARIFSGFSSLEVECFSPTPSDGSISYPIVNEQEFYRIVDENERDVMKDVACRVAIFRDREKDRSDPDYDRNYDRYVRGPAPNLTFCMGGCNTLQFPFPQYEAGFSQISPMPGNPCMSYIPSNMSMSQFSPFGSSQTSKDAVYMQWPSPAMMYTHSYEHFRHGVFQAPYYQQPLSFEHLQNL